MFSALHLPPSFLPVPCHCLSLMVCHTCVVFIIADAEYTTQVWQAGHGRVPLPFPYLFSLRTVLLHSFSLTPSFLTPPTQLQTLNPTPPPHQVFCADVRGPEHPPFRLPPCPPTQTLNPAPYPPLIRYSAPMFVDLKKTETSVGEDGTIEEHEEKYDKVLFGKVCVWGEWGPGGREDIKSGGGGRTAPSMRSLTNSCLERCMWGGSRGMCVWGNRLTF